jgi:CubicO group peptidase (beta-lactamase class C family)
MRPEDLMRRVAFVAFIAAGLFTFLPCAAPAQVPGSPDLSGLGAVAMAEMKEAGIPGAAVAVVWGERVIYARGFGTTSVETGVAVSPDTLFRLGSTTKMLTAAAVVSLAEEGRLRLDAPVASYISGLDPAIGRLTPHQLLSHTAGLRDDAVMSGLHDDSALASGVRAISRDALFTAPGRLFSYANPGYWVAGYLAETVAGRPYADVMAARVFGPLGMTRTTLRPLVAMTWPLAQGHEMVDGRLAVIRPAADNVANWPAGSVFSSANDLARWVIAFLNDGRVDGRQALPPALFSTLSTPRVDQPGVGRPRYGYGVTLATWRGVRLIQHGGSRAGYGSSVTLAPDQQVGIVVLANRTGADLPRTVAAAAERLLPLGPVVRRRPRPAVAMSATDVQRYVGTYAQSTSEPGGVILPRQGGLLLRTGAGDALVTCVGENAFEIVRPDGSVEDVWFVAGPDGRAAFLYRGTRAHPLQ